MTRSGIPEGPLSIDDLMESALPAIIPPINIRTYIPSVDDETGCPDESAEVLNTNQDPWIERFKRECLRVPGKHILVLGITGSGKNQLLYWIIDGLRMLNPKETIVWLDTGKSSDFLALAQFLPLTLFIPDGPHLNIDVSTRDEYKDIWVVRFRDFEQLWNSIEPGRINIICLERFIRDPVTYSKVISLLFGTLIDMAYDYLLKVPIAIVADEFHRIAPAKDHEEDPIQKKTGAKIQFCIENLRSLGVRFVCSSQNWTKLRKGVRSSFNFLLIKRGVTFERDKLKLFKFSTLWEKFRVDQTAIVYEDQNFSDPVRLPFYGDGEDFGRVLYQGRMEIKKRRTAPWE